MRASAAFPGQLQVPELCVGPPQQTHAFYPQQSITANTLFSYYSSVNTSPECTRHRSAAAVALLSLMPHTAACCKRCRDLPAGYRHPQCRAAARLRLCRHGCARKHQASNCKSNTLNLGCGPASVLLHPAKLLLLGRP